MWFPRSRILLQALIVGFAVAMATPLAHGSASADQLAGAANNPPAPVGNDPARSLRRPLAVLTTLMRMYGGHWEIQIVPIPDMACPGGTAGFVVIACGGQDEGDDSDDHTIFVVMEVVFHNNNPPIVPPVKKAPPTDPNY